LDRDRDGDEAAAARLEWCFLLAAGDVDAFPPDLARLRRVGAAAEGSFTLELFEEDPSDVCFLLSFRDV
jgi:hypothetical protein